MGAKFRPGMIELSFKIGAPQTDIIKFALQQLEYYRDDGRVPTQELLDDISAYRSILEATNAEARAEAYFLLKKENLRFRPREIARSLGWL